jgi:hypothetical protein
MYRALDADKIVDTTRRLSRRIRERFPDRGLNKVCAEVEQVARETQERCQWIRKPRLGLRLGVAVAILILLISFAGLVLTFGPADELDPQVDFYDFVQVLEAGLNDVVMVAVAIFFLVTLETRLKRNKALESLHELRALAHVIDMHQLTKDPERLLRRGPDTESSPVHTLGPFELTRYLDYCSEMLSMVGKIGALYAQNLNDAVVLSAVNEIEELTTAMSQKIWQKISQLQEMELQGLIPKGSTRDPGDEPQ